MAVMLSEEQFQALITTLGRSHGGVGGGGGARKKRLDMKYMRLNDFSGKAEDWTDWAFAFRRAVRVADRDCFDMMEEVERDPKEIDETKLEDGFAEDGDAAEVSTELYDLLCTVVKGDALAVLKSVDEFKGFQAWQKLWMRFNPKTSARAIRLLTEVCSPGQVKHLHEVESGLQRWKEKVKILEREFDEKLNNRMKIAIATSILPVAIQDHVFQTVDDATTFENMMAKISAWVSNRVAMQGVPMDVGQVEEEEWWSEEWEVGAVGAWTQCHACRGYGHLAKDCPNNKGKGKGKDQYGKGGFKGNDKGGGKGNYYGKGNNYGKGGKGFDKGGGKGNFNGKGGKGYLGTCFACGKVGHKAAECRAVHNVEPQQQGQEQGNTAVEEVSVGAGVWVIGAVNTEWKKPKVKRESAKKASEPHFAKCGPNAVLCGKLDVTSTPKCMPKTWSSPPGLEMTNMFKALQVQDDEEEGFEDVGEELGGLGESASSPLRGKHGAGNSVPRASTHARGRARHLEVNAGEGNYTFEDHLKELYGKVGTAKLWNSDGERLKTFGQDRTAKLRSDDDSECLKTLEGPGACRSEHSDRCAARCSVRCPVRREIRETAVGINAVETPPAGRKAAMKFHVAAVQRPLASAVKVVQAGNRVVMSATGSFIENERSGERMPLRVERGTFVFDVEYTDGSPGTITLDSGAGVNVWPEHLLPAIPMQPPEQGLRMTAANGTEIPSRGVKTVEFRSRGAAPSSGGSRHA
jgi:hypothetical protein